MEEMEKVNTLPNGAQKVKLFFFCLPADRSHSEYPSFRAYQNDVMIIFLISHFRSGLSDPNISSSVVHCKAS